MNRNILLQACLIAIAGAASAAETPRASELTDTLRDSLETQFRAGTGLGFASFECDLLPDSPPGQELTCQAVDEEGDRFSYRITSNPDGGSPLVSTSQPVAQLDAAGRAQIERPCLVFLDAFERSAWNEAHQELSDDFKASYSPADLAATLTPLREVLGDLRMIEAQSYAGPSPGIHRLEYSLDTEGGAAVARFQLQFVDDEQARITAFLVTAQPGTALQARLLSTSGRHTLAPLLEQPVARIDGPLADLERIGDAIEGQAVLEDGAALQIRVVQRGTAHDLDGDDYRFQVIDVPWLIHRYLTSTGAAPSGIDCPARSAPDGGRLDCTATLGDGSERSIAIIRQGGDHRILPPE